MRIRRGTKMSRSSSMNRTPRSFTSLCGRALLIALPLFMGSSLLIAELGDHVMRIKEVFYSWLLVLFNAYIGIFIANQALKRESGGFFAWAFVGNGMRSIAFLILLFCILEWEILHVRGFVLKTFFGYFTFLALLIYGLHNHMKGLSSASPCRQDDE